MARILVVDDEADMRLALSNVLSRTGHQVLEAPEGETALQVLGRERVECVLLDMRLPGMDGIQILRRIREMDAELPVIMVTGYGSVDSAIEVMRLGASHYLAKPFSNKELVETVERTLEARRVPVPAGGGRELGETVPAAAVPRPAGPVAFPAAPSRRDFTWLIAGAAVLAALAWPGVQRWLDRGREHPVTFSHPSALAFSGTRLFAADWFTNSVYESAVTGGELKTVRVIPMPGTHVMGLAVAKDKVYVSDPWKKQIQRRGKDDKMTLEHAVKSPGRNPSGLFFDGRYLWSADSDAAKIYQHELDDELTVIASFKSPGKAPAALFKDDRYFWSADAETRLIYQHRLDSELKVLATYHWPGINEGPQPLSCFTLRGGSVWLGRDGLAKLLERPLRGFTRRDRE